MPIKPTTTNSTTPLFTRLDQANAISQEIQRHEEIIARLQADLAGLLGVKASPGLRVSHSPRPSSTRPSSLPLAQPTLQEIITKIIVDAGHPVSIPEILDEMARRNYRMQSAAPKKALSVKLYTDKTFKTASRGKFTLRQG